MYFRSLATENSSEYSTRENITDYSTSGRGEYFKQTLIIIFIQRNYYFLTKSTEQIMCNADLRTSFENFYFNH
jgi:hypothetical protein